MEMADEQTLARMQKLEREQEALVLAHSELGVASEELHAKLEAANSSHKEAVAALAASEARAAELERVLASCRRDLEAARNADSEAAAAKAALEGRVAKTDAHVAELEASLVANQKEVHHPVCTACPVLN
jgi:chromosome segregation ATPase